MTHAYWARGAVLAVMLSQRDLSWIHPSSSNVDWLVRDSVSLINPGINPSLYIRECENASPWCIGCSQLGPLEFRYRDAAYERLTYVWQRYRCHIWNPRFESTLIEYVRGCYVYYLLWYLRT